jgi:hypothetical protein
VPPLPASGSGTRDTFLLVLGELYGLPPGTQLTPGTCVNNGKDPVSGFPVEENTGLSTADQNVFGNVDTVFPYSVADYIAQGPAANGVGGHATPIWGHGVLGLHDMTDDSGTAQTPTTTTSSNQVVINLSFPAEMQRAIYNVVRNGGTVTAPAFPTTPAYEATALPAIFGPNGWICTSPTAQADLISYGFYSEGAHCGALTTPPQEPALTDLVGVGADTTFPLFSASETTQTSGALAPDYNATNPASKLYSWAPVNPSTGTVGGTIITKRSSPGDTTCSMFRPLGSEAGITTLENSKTDGGNPCIDYAPSSRAPASTDPTTIAFAAMAADAIAWSSPAGTASTPSPVPAPIVPVLPANGSGTRATFLLALGGGTTPLTPGICVVNGTDSSGHAIEENTGVTAGNASEFGTASAPKVDAVFPYSIGDYIGQGPAANGVGGHASSIWAHGPLAVRAMTDTSNVVQQPTSTNTSSQTIINPNYPSSMRRTLFNVVRNGGTATAPAWPTSPAYEATALPAIFGASGWICTNATAKADIISYGFANLGRNCGALTAG